MMRRRTWAIALWICAIAVLPARCQDPWKTENASIYKLEFFASELNFEKARALCTSRSAKMIRLDNEQVRDKVQATIKSATKVDYFWIGATGTLYEWTWLEETNLADTSFMTWHNAKPDNHKGKEHYLIVVNSDGSYGDVAEKLEEVGTICQKTLDPWKYEVVSNYKLEYFDFVATFDNAEELCKARSGMVIRMDDDEIRTKVNATIKSATTVGYFWIGATRENGEWKWLGEATAADTSFVTWADGQPDKDGVKSYLVVGKAAKYTDVEKDFNNVGTICQIGRYCTVHPNTCSNSRTCSSLPTSPYYTCQCTDGYYGDTCADQYCAAHSNTCKNRGTCSSLKISPYYNCKCADGYYGNTCTDQYCAWHSDTCKNGGTCSSSSTSPYYTCQCADGYYGNTCTDQYCDTHTNPCQHNGTCSSSSTSPYYTCQCADGYYGNTCTDQYCAAHTGTCKNGGRCLPTLTRPYYNCECADGYYENTCTDEYCEAHSKTCKNGGTCSSSTTSPYFTCQCADGYYGNTCTDQYCAAHTETCKNGGTCSSQTSSPYYNCQCAAGHYGNTCTDQYCAAHTETCKNGGTCSSVTTPLYYTCYCASGYYGNNCTERYCTAKANINPCQNHGTCSSTFTSPHYYSCRCAAGYYGRTCANQYCAEYPSKCKNKGTCLSFNSLPYFSCQCADGYYGNTCTDTYCTTYPTKCENGGRCTSITSNPYFTCQCADGYYGDVCRNQYCAAHSNTCKNGGTCSSSTKSPYYTCQCGAGYYGTTCTDQYCAAHTETCKNGGTCSSVTTPPYYTCDCASGYYRNNCTERYCAAHANPCKNRGICSSTFASPYYYSCRCAAGYYGRTCANRYCDLHGSVCGPAGTCSSTLTSPFYTCRCDAGYRGDHCTNGVTNFNGYRLETVFELKTFDQANSECKSRGGILFEPRSATMNNAIKTLLKSPYGHFIGLRNLNTGKRRNQWQWESDNAKATYTNWIGGSPKNYRSGSNPLRCVRIVGLSGEWENIACTSKRNYACQTHGICNTACRNDGECLATEEAPYYKCKCTQGYYKQNCTEYMKVTSPGDLISVAGDELLLINATVTATEERVNVYLYKNLDLIESVPNFETNATVQFRLNWVNKSTDGDYTISAKTINGDFTANVSFAVTVHVKADIKVIKPRFIYSPAINGSDQVLCKAIGIPKPSVSWYRGTLPVETQFSTTGVYQTNSTTSKRRKAYLHIINAKLYDNGTYTCKATNRVGPNKQVVTAGDFAFLAVYGTPTIQIVSPEKCSVKGSVNVLWAPNNQTTVVVHRLTVQSLNATVSDNATQMTADKNVAFDNLLPSTKYELQITVCPDECISKLNATTEFITGVGLPGELHNPVLKNNSDSSVCVVSWDWPTTTPTEQISHVEVTWKASLVFTSENNLKEGKSNTSTKNVTFPPLQSNISTLPNRDYSVSVRAFTCAGPGPNVTATGICVTEASAPTDVQKPTISKEDTSDGFRTINVALPDESNGRISCILVMMTEQSDSPAMDGIVDENTIRKASFSALSEKPRTGESYIAIAIPRSNFTTSTYASKIGDNRTSYCDVHGSVQSKRSKREVHETSLRGKNWPLHEGSIYSYFTVTTTPTSSGHVHFARSESATFVNDQPFHYTLMIILIIVAVIVVGVSAYGYYRYRNRNKGEIEERTEEEATYENIVLDELNSGTAIPLSRLLDVYKAMKTDKSVKFHKEFQELKLQAETVMTPATVAGKEEMVVKNRYKNILPFDATRVVLQGEGFESYINACNITGKEKDFIATQGPLPITVVDFWRLIVEQKVKIIVMLAKCREAGKHKCAKYWPNVGKDVKYGNLKIENTDEQFFGAYVKRTFKIFTPQEVQRAVLQFQFLNWPDHGVPVTTSSFFRLHKAVMDKHKELGNDSPLLVHCSAGVGRTGTFIGYDILLHESNQKRSIDIFACLLDMRRQRVEMVQTSAQYELLHKLLLENFMFGGSDITKDDLAKMQLQMRLERKRIEKEFQNLSAAEPLSAQVHGDEAGASSKANFGKILIVRLPEDTEWILIDASRVEAFDNTDLIAAHGPFRSTSEYFWRAVLDNNVETIVMLNRVDEGSEDPQTCAIQYWPDSSVGTLQFNNVTVQIMGEQLSGDIWTRNLLVSRRDQPQKTITHLQYLGWPSGGVPENTAAVLNLASKIPTVAGMEKPGAVLIHCSDGLGRTGAFCTILNIIARMKIENHVDIFRAVKDLRDYRPGVVKTLEEYTFCYKAAQAYLEASNIYTEVSRDQGEQQIYENLK